MFRRWRPGIARDKASLDIFWLRDESLGVSDNLPDPHVLAEEIADDLEDVLGDLSAQLSADTGK